MRLSFIIMFLLSFNIFAQSVETDQNKSKVETASQIEEDIQIKCQNFILNFFKLTVDQQQSQAQSCQLYFKKELKEAIELTHKSEATACEFLELKEQVYQFNELIKNHVNAKTPDQEVVQSMREYFEVMYSEQTLHECSDTAHTELLLFQYELKNSHISESFTS